MTDTARSWIEERRGIHTTAAEGQWLDAYMNLPRALSALEQVLELHQRKTVFDGELDYCGICVESEGAFWPCSTVRAIEGAINESDADV